MISEFQAIRFMIAEMETGTVSGDIHDFGKTLVATIFEAGGYRVVDLGRDVPTEEFIKAAKEEEADVVAASTLMTLL